MCKFLNVFFCFFEQMYGKEGISEEICLIRLDQHIHVSACCRHTISPNHRNFVVQITGDCTKNRP